MLFLGDSSKKIRRTILVGISESILEKISKTIPERFFENPVKQSKRIFGEFSQYIPGKISITIAERMPGRALEDFMRKSMIKFQGGISEIILWESFGNS